MSPSRAWTVCSTTGCPTLTPAGACDNCRRKRKRNQAAQRRAAGDPAMTVYTSEAWRRQRRSFLERHPHCIRCSAPATEADHIVPRRILVAVGIHDPDADQWLQPLCQSDHARKTRTVDQPLLARWEQGEDPQALAEEAMG